MPGANQYTAQQFIEAIPGSGGIISAIARRLGCSWHTAKKYISQYLTVQQAYADECESILDLAEVKLIEAVKAGDLAAIKYLLSTKGKRRGYIEGHEVAMSGQVDIGIKDGAERFDAYLARLIAAKCAAADREGQAGGEDH